MQLYTVKMTTKHLVSVFDKRGNKVEDKIELIPITFTDVPLQTAHMYRDKNPDGNVQLIAQHSVVDDKSYRDKPGKYAAKRSYNEAPKKASVVAKPKPKKDAAITGDLSAALN